MQRTADKVDVFVAGQSFDRWNE